MTRSRHPALLLLLLAPASCGPADAGTAAPGAAGNRSGAAPDITCGDARERPAPGAPAEGVWLYDGKDHRVAATVGPPHVSAGQTKVMRRVETLEAGAGADTIRHVSDTAAVRLQFMPPGTRPAAVYPVGPQVLLASYESCDPGLPAPLIRYLRQDTAGRVATDVMLRRQSAAP